MRSEVAVESPMEGRRDGNGVVGVGSLGMSRSEVGWSGVGDGGQEEIQTQGWSARPSDTSRSLRITGMDPQRLVQSDVSNTRYLATSLDPALARPQGASLKIMLGHVSERLKLINSKTELAQKMVTDKKRYELEQIMRAIKYIDKELGLEIQRRNHVLDFMGKKMQETLINIEGQCMEKFSQAREMLNQRIDNEEERYNKLMAEIEETTKKNKINGEVQDRDEEETRKLISAMENAAANENDAIKSNVNEKYISNKFTQLIGEIGTNASNRETAFEELSTAIKSITTLVSDLKMTTTAKVLEMGDCFIKELQAEQNEHDLVTQNLVDTLDDIARSLIEE